MHLSRSTLRPLIRGCVLLGMLLAHGAVLAQPMEIATAPPFLPTPAEPNIVLTLDASGSMRFAKTPHSICSIETDPKTRGARRTKSSAFN